MRLIILFLLFHLINLYLISETFSYIIIDSYNFTLDLIPYKKGFSSNLEQNQFSELNNLFYYLTSDDNNWKLILKRYRNTHFVFYLDGIETFNKNYQELKKEKKISALIIGGVTAFVRGDFLINIDDTYSNNNKLIFINKNRDIIKNIYRIFSIRNLCSIYINYLYTGDIFCDKFIIYIGIFISLCIIIYSIICYKARQNNKYLFIQDYILTNLFFYFFHTLLFYYISSKQKYKYFTEENYSGAIYVLFNSFQFFSKLLPNILATGQLNNFEIREHSYIYGHSKIIHLFSCNIFFIISFQKESTETSETLNCCMYIVNLMCIIYMYFCYKNLFHEKYIDSIENDPDYISALNLKKKLLYFHFLSISLFILFHLCFYCYMRYYLNEYRTIKFIFIFINYSDLILLLILALVYYPRELPPYYIEEERDIGENSFNNQNVDENDEFKTIYNFAFNQKDEEIYFKNFQKDENTNANIVLIENPFNENKLEEINNNNNKEGKILIIKEKNENDNQNKEDNNVEKDILDLTHTKLGFIDFSF